MDEVRISMSASIGNLVAAMVKVQGSLPTIQRAKRADIQTLKGGKMSYTYADLAAVWSTARRVLTENGLVLLQPFALRDGKAMLQTLLAHTSGEWVAGELQIALDASDPRKVGSTITYYRRYCLGAMVGAVTADEDDDAASVADQSRRPTSVTVRRPGAPQTRSPREETRAPREETRAPRQEEPPPRREEQPPAGASTKGHSDRPAPPVPSVGEFGKAVVALKVANDGAYPEWWTDRYAQATNGLDLTEPLLSKPNMVTLIDKRPVAAAELYAEVQAALGGRD